MLTDFFPGSQFRQYKLIEQIGIGGIGLVWSALDQVQNCIVAIKLNKIDEENQPVNYLMLDRHITGLHHPSVMPTYDFGIWKNIQYIVTPYIPGGSLEDRISERIPIPLPEALQYAAEIVSALDYLHAENVIHRDLKPANILINFNYRLYVADFDLARVLTQTTQSMHTGRGTPAYAPPEQHTKAAVTPQSDIYSLGIVLYEMFTLRLPWNGEKSLGIQQLSGNVEIPDPRDENPSLPSGLVHALRKMTAASPEDRPASAGEALQMVYSCFGIEPIEVSAYEIEREADTRISDGRELLKRSLEEWKHSQERVVPNLTKFAYIDSVYRITNEPLPADSLRFMLNTALIYGYQNDYWWSRLDNARERLGIAGRLVNKNNEIGAERIVDHLVHDNEVQALKGPLPKGLIKNLLEITYKTKNEPLRENILTLVRALLPAPRRWRETTISAEDDANIALLATRDNPSGDKAARLIGYLHSKTAVQFVVKNASPERRFPALQLIHKTAGSLPSNVPSNLRTAVIGTWIQKIITEQPNSMLMVFVMVFLGTAIGTSLQIYFSYRLPSFLDLERISISLEQGAFIGFVFGLGILITRLITERITTLEAFPRVVLSSIIGAAVINAGIFTYDVLFLKNAPNGNLITAACLLLTLGFSASALLHSLPIRMLISGVAALIALAGSWWTHVILAGNTTSLSPIFYYEYTWTVVQVWGIALLVAVPMAVLGNLYDLRINDL